MQPQTKLKYVKLRALQEKVLVPCFLLSFKMCDFINSTMGPIKKGTGDLAF